MPEEAPFSVATAIDYSRYVGQMWSLTNQIWMATIEQWSTESFALCLVLRLITVQPNKRACWFKFATRCEAVAAIGQNINSWPNAHNQRDLNCWRGNGQLSRIRNTRQYLAELGMIGNLITSIEWEQMWSNTLLAWETQIAQWHVRCRPTSTWIIVPAAARRNCIAIRVVHYWNTLPALIKESGSFRELK